MSETTENPAQDATKGIRLAVEYIQQNKGSEALQLLLQLTRNFPRHHFAWDRLGLVLRAAENLPQAKAAFAKAAELKPKDANYHDHYGVVCRALGDKEDAVKSYRKALELAPDRASTWGNLGNVLRDMEDFEEALKAYRKAVELSPDTPQMRVNLISALIGADYGDEAVAQARRAIELAPDHGSLYSELANALLRQDKHEEAVIAYQRWVELDGKVHGVFHNMGTALQQIGRLDEAEEAYKRAIEIQPDFGPSLRQLASIVKFDPKTADLSEIEDLIEEEGLDASQRADLYFTMAKANDDLKNYDQAFTFLQSANQIVRKGINYGADRNTMFVDRIIKTYDRAFFEERKDFGLDSDVPILILGMPRSGTTLVEQIVSSHPRVFGAGELMKMSELSSGIKNRFETKKPYPEGMDELDRDKVQAIAGDYLACLRGFDADAPHVTDKMPFNFRLLGLITLMFPKAKIIHCRRHPYDIIISCYFARFKEQLAFSYNLLEAARYIRDYERIMDHWRQVLDIEIYHSRYDELVADQELRSRELIAFCGLEWDDQCLSFHENKRPVMTASNWQVRQPMYSSSLERWRKYEKHLAPLRTVLGPPEAVYP